MFYFCLTVAFFLFMSRLGEIRDAVREMHADMAALDEEDDKL